MHKAVKVEARISELLAYRTTAVVWINHPHPRPSLLLHLHLYPQTLVLLLDPLLHRPPLMVSQSQQLLALSLPPFFSLRSSLHLDCFSSEKKFLNHQATSEDFLEHWSLKSTCLLTHVNPPLSPHTICRKVTVVLILQMPTRRSLRTARTPSKTLLPSRSLIINCPHNIFILAHSNLHHNFILQFLVILSRVQSLIL